MTRRYFIAGTGTGIGKTFTTCALLHAAQAQGIETRTYKPIISGWMDDADSDTAHIIAAGGSIQTFEEVSPWRFKAPLSPHRAAALEKKSLTLSALLHWSPTIAPLTLIEGVGGVMVPINNSETTRDWMEMLGWPIILVTGSYLGSISHTLTALEVLKRAGLDVAALVMNESAESTVDFAEAQAGLMPFIKTIPLRIFQPRVSSWREATEIAKLANILVGN